MTVNHYEEVYGSFVWNRPEHFNFANDVIDKVAREDPSRLAMLWVDDCGNERSVSYSELSAASKRVANVFLDAGVREGDTVILMLGRQVAWWEIMTACIRSGMVVSPGTTQLSSSDIQYRVNAAEAAAIITDTENADKVDEIAQSCPTLKARLLVGAERKGWIDYDAAVQSAASEFETRKTPLSQEMLCFFTSGTTGYPKMVTHSQAYALGHEVTGKYWLGLNSGDLHWNIADNGWAKASWSSYFGPWSQGATIFVHHTTGFAPARVLELLQKYPVTSMCGAPTIYRMLVLENLDGYRAKQLKSCVSAGEPLNPEVIEVWKQATGITIRDGYGQSETVVLCGSFPGLDIRLGSMGKPAPGVDLQVIGHDGQILPPDTEGDIAVRLSPEPPMGLFAGYKGNPEKTKECFVGDWYLTGDRAYRDKDGYFWFVGRSDDVILSAGYRIGPFEVESALIEHPAVVESAVVSSPDETRGEVVKAFVVLAPGYEPSDVLAQEIKDHVKKVTAPYKYPRKLEFVGELPKTVSGKIRRIELRDQEWGR